MGEYGSSGNQHGVPYSHLTPRDVSMRNQASDASRLPDIGGSSGELQNDASNSADDLSPTGSDTSPVDAYPTPDQTTLPHDHIDLSSAVGQRFYTRRLIQEFLTSVPRSEPEARLTFLRLDGTLRVLTRAEFSAIIDNLRPRQRQLVRLAIEERWPRQRVCDYLQISLKTFERHHQEVLDLLAQM
ncbi:MAG: hypothetical protein ACXWP6_02715 [Ktedonobacterales bacterium]